jgi:hypothetical protein
MDEEEDEIDMDVEDVMPVPVPMKDEEVVAFAMGNGGSEKLVDVKLNIVPFVGEMVTLVGRPEDVDVMFMLYDVEEVEVMSMLEDVEVILGKKLNEEEELDVVMSGMGGLVDVELV